MRLITNIFHLLVLSLGILQCSTSKAFGEEEISSHVATSLVSEVSHIQSNQPFWVAIHLKMESGWHTYWENPGEAGLATSVEWDLPEGFQASPLHWPIPKKFELNDFVNYGYENEVLLMAMITPPPHLEVGKDISITARINWLECKEACIPGEAQQTLTLPISSQATEWNADWHARFQETRLQHPLSTQAWQVTAHYENNELGLLITPKENDVPELTGAITFFSKNPDIAFNKEQNLVRLKQGYFLKLAPSDDFKPEEKNTLSGILYHSNGWLEGHSAKTLTINAEVTQGLPKDTLLPMLASSSLPSVGIIKAIIFAFMGGIILNLMPCVFPILSIKILGFIQKSGQDSKKLKAHGMFFSAGVILSFWVLSFLLIALRASGEHLGWGFQLQSSYFVVFLCGLLVLIGLNLAGVFEFGGRLSYLSGKIKNSEGLLGSFSSGVLATVLATPCTAPFMGSALGFALSQTSLGAFYIFTALATGMALPYVFLSFFPTFLHFLPKPGSWMETFKQAMAFPIFGTVLWLLWVFSHNATGDELIAVLFGLLFISCSAWVYGRFVTQGESRWKRINGMILSFILIAGGGFISYQAALSKDGNDTASTPHQTQESKTAPTQLSYNGIEVQPFSEELLESLRREGKAVYVDFTAKWCLTCQMNKKLVFSNKKVQKYFKNHDIVILKADWTNHNANITASLNSFGRSGIPFNVYYPPSSTEPVTLPEVLTPKIVLDTLKKTERS